MLNEVLDILWMAPVTYVAAVCWKHEREARQKQRAFKQAALSDIQKMTKGEE